MRTRVRICRTCVPFRKALARDAEVGEGGGLIVRSSDNRIVACARYFSRRLPPVRLVSHPHFGALGSVSQGGTSGLPGWRAVRCIRASVYRLAFPPLRPPQFIQRRQDPGRGGQTIAVAACNGRIASAW